MTWADVIIGRRKGAERLDAGYADNHEDLAFAKDGTPTLKRLPGIGTSAVSAKQGADNLRRRLRRSSRIWMSGRSCRPIPGPGGGLFPVNATLLRA